MFVSTIFTSLSCGTSNPASRNTGAGFDINRALNASSAQVRATSFAYRFAISFLSEGGGGVIEPPQRASCVFNLGQDEDGAARRRQHNAVCRSMKIDAASQEIVQGRFHGRAVR